MTKKTSWRISVNRSTLEKVGSRLGDLRLEKGFPKSSSNNDCHLFLAMQLKWIILSDASVLISKLKQWSPLERTHESFDSTPKRRKSDEYLPSVQSSDIQQQSVMPSASSTQSVSSDVGNKISQTVDNQIDELKKMIAKMYALQKRTSTSVKVRILL